MTEGAWGGKDDVYIKVNDIIHVATRLSVDAILCENPFREFITCPMVFCPECYEKSLS